MCAEPPLTTQGGRGGRKLGCPAAAFPDTVDISFSLLSPSVSLGWRPPNHPDQWSWTQMVWGLPWPLLSPPSVISGSLFTLKATQEPSSSALSRLRMCVTENPTQVTIGIIKLASLSKNSRRWNTISANWSVRSQLCYLLFWLPFKVGAGHSRPTASWTQVRWKRGRWLLSTQPQLKAQSGSLAHSVLGAWPWTGPYGHRNATHGIVLHGLRNWRGGQGMARGQRGPGCSPFLLISFYVLICRTLKCNPKSKLSRKEGSEKHTSML